MIRKFLLSGDMKQFSSFVSTAFFEVMPARELWRSARQLFDSSRDREAFRDVVAERSALLSRARLAVELSVPRESKISAPERSVQPEDAQRRGSLVVSLYFHQLIHGSRALLDLRHQSFSAAGEQLAWHPAPWIAAWDPAFIAGLREVYGGFYGGDDDRFRAGLEALELSHAEAIFRRHFGAGQRQVRFRTREFVDAFHQVFVACREHGSSLHPDFLPLGLYLATLYEHLEELAVTVDVVTCFEQALSLSPVSAAHISHGTLE
jgi:hypothetical protein